MLLPMLFPFLRSLRNAFTRTIAPISVGALASVLAGCASGGFVLPGTGEDRSVYGSYLAARHAESLRDTRAAASYYTEALEDAPGNTALLERAFLMRVAGGELGKAAPLAEKLLTSEPDNRFARIALAVDAFRDGNQSEARRLADLDGGDPVTNLAKRLVIAWSYASQDNTEAAIEALSPDDGSADLSVFRLFHTGLIYQSAGELDKALEAYAGAYQQQGGQSLRIVLGYGELLQEAGRSEDAIRLYETFLRVAPDHPLILAALDFTKAGDDVAGLAESPEEGLAEGFYGIAAGLARAQVPDLAVVYLHHALYLNDELDLAWTLLGNQYADVRSPEKALRAFEQVSRRSPLYANAVMERSVALRQLDRAEEAVTLLEDLVAQNPEVFVFRVTLGDAYGGMERWAEAAQTYERAIAMLEAPQEQHWSLFFAAGVAYERQKIYDQAEVYLKRSLELSPDQPFVLNYLGYTWIEAGKNLDEGMEMIRRAVDLRPDSGAIVDSLGWGYYQLGQYDKAVDVLERAVTLEPGDPTINDHLGDAYWQVGRKLEAKFQWNHALAADPEPDQAERIKEKLQHGLDAMPATQSVDAGPVPAAAPTD